MPFRTPTWSWEDLGSECWVRVQKQGAGLREGFPSLSGFPRMRSVRGVQAATLLLSILPSAAPLLLQGSVN